MEKYKSYHFSPLNRRSLLHPQQENGYKRGERKTFAPLSEEQINHHNPYQRANEEIEEKTYEAGGIVKKYIVFAPKSLESKCPALILFPDSGVSAKKFIEEGNWRKLAQKYKTALLVLQNEKWDKNKLDENLDYVWSAIQCEFRDRPTVDICEACIYPIGFGEGAYMATAFALLYSAAVPAFAAYGDCSMDPEFLDILRVMPAEGVAGKRKTEIAMAGFITDCTGNAQQTFNYLKEIINSREEGLYNELARVYLERPRAGAYFMNEQPVAQLWIGECRKMSAMSSVEVSEKMLRFVLRFSRWGGSGHNYLRHRGTTEENGVKRIYRNIQGVLRYWDIYIPSAFEKNCKKEYPLVVAIHGMSCNSDYFAGTSDWHRLAEEREFFVCYASAYPHNDGLARFTIPHWAVKNMNMPEKDELIYFKEMLDEMVTEYPIDRKRIYAVGHSNGSMMTQELARKMPEYFAAFGPTGALGGWSSQDILPITGNVRCPVWFIMGEYDISPTDTGEGTVARATLDAFCRLNKVIPQYENWYDNGNYRTLVMYDADHIPMVRYTIVKDCPHTYTAEMAQFTWDHFLCHFSREKNGEIRYLG